MNRQIQYTLALVCAKNRVDIFSSFLDIRRNVEWPHFLAHPVQGGPIKTAHGFFFQLKLIGQINSLLKRAHKYGFSTTNILLKIWLMKPTKHNLTNYKMSNTVCMNSEVSVHPAVKALSPSFSAPSHSLTFPLYPSPSPFPSCSTPSAAKQPLCNQL